MHSGARPACVRGLLLGSVLPGSAEEAHGVGSKSAERLHRERLNGLKACGRDGWVARALTGLGKTKRGPCRQRGTSPAPRLTGRHTGPRFAEQCPQFVDNTGVAVRFKTPILAHDCVVPQRVQSCPQRPPAAWHWVRPITSLQCACDAAGVRARQPC